MAPKHRRWAVALFALLAAVYVLGGPWARIRRTNLTHEQYAARFDGVTLPPTASDISLYVHKAWGDEDVVISFTVPDEQTFIDWATRHVAKPEASEATKAHANTFDGGQLHLQEIGEHLRAHDGHRGSKYCTFACYDKITCRVYFHKYTNPSND